MPSKKKNIPEKVLTTPKLSLRNRDIARKKDPIVISDSDSDSSDASHFKFKNKQKKSSLTCSNLTRIVDTDVDAI